MSSSTDLGVMSPGGCLVVGSAGFEAAIPASTCTSSSSARSPAWPAIIACSRAIPAILAIPSGSLAFASTAPGLSITPAS